MKKILGIVLALVMVFAMSGIAMADEAGYSGELKVWVSEESVGYTQELVDMFKAANPEYAGMTVVIQPVGEGDAASNMITDVEAGADIYTFAHDQLARLVAAGALEIVDYLNAHQKFNDCFTGQVSEGKLTGLGGKNNFDGTERLELHGFTDGAVLSPMISPNTFLCYVFFVKDASEMSAFEETLKNQADLAWNVCVVANTVITQTDGTAVLFIMCDE